MRRLWLLCALAASVCPAQDVSGSYQASFDQAPKNSRGILKAIFGQDPIVIEWDGRFDVYAIQLSGFWRLHGNQIVFTYATLFGHPFPKPDDILRKAWPTEIFEGFVARRREDGSFEVAGVGAVRGPVVFRRMPPRSTLELVRRLGADDATSIEPFVTLMDVASARFADLVHIVRDPRADWGDRSWAALMLPERMTADQQRSALATLDFVTRQKSSDSARVTHLRRCLSTSLLKHPSEATFVALVDGQHQEVLSLFQVALSIGTNGMASQAPRLTGFLANEDRYVVEAACRALAKLGHRESLPQLRALTAHGTVSVQGAAWAAILKLSDDPAERRQAVHEIGKAIRKDVQWSFRLIEALGECGLREAVPYLVEVLENGGLETDRARAAEGLGRLGFPEAVPALLAAKHVEVPDIPEPKNTRQALVALGRLFEGAFDGIRVRKAVVEALWSFDQRARARAK